MLPFGEWLQLLALAHRRNGGPYSGRHECGLDATQGHNTRTCAKCIAAMPSRPVDRAKELYSDVAGAVLTCSFCGKNQNEVRKIIAGPHVYICNECVVEMNVSY